MDNITTFATSFAAGYSEFYHFVKLMIDSPAWPDCYNNDIDAGILNLNFYYYFQKKYHVPFNMLDCESGFYSLDHCGSRLVQVNDILNGIENKENPTKSIPPAIFVHSGLNHPSLNHFVENNCPPKMKINEIK